MTQRTATAAGAALPYRAELDGLRAIAVLAVLGYHAGFNDMAGGFVGVDVFLVLSGYLITQQVTALQGAGTFGLVPFWLRRARRLVPAMIPVLVFALVSALLLKGDDAFGDFLWHMLGSGVFVSNYLFLSQADYFAPASDTNLLLHTWSLSLEMQFYLIMPLVLLALGRGGAGLRILALSALATASLLLAEVLIRGGSESWAFFGILPRFWEFALGGIVALLPRVPAALPGLGFLLRGLGLAMILWVVGGYSGTPFPGLGAVLPVLGTVLVLVAPETGIDPLRWVLESRVMRWLGLRSYAIYLVHWPLFVTVTPSAMNGSEDVLSVALLVSIGLGHLIYRYVEQPVRQGPRFATTRAMAMGLATVLGGLVVIGGLLLTPVAHSLRSVLPLLPLREAVSEIEADRATYRATLDGLTDPSATGNVQLVYCSYDHIESGEEMFACLSRAPSDAVLVIGDSHGRDTLLSLQIAFPDQSFVMLHQSSCVSARYFDRAWCFESMPEVLDRYAASDRLDRVILTSRWGYGFHSEAEQTLQQLQRLGADVTVIGPGPTFDPHIEAMIVRASLQGENLLDVGRVSRGLLAFDLARANRELEALSIRYGATYFDREVLFCDAESCRVRLRDARGYAFFDNQHLTPKAFGEFAQDLESDPALQQLMNVNPSR